MLSSSRASELKQQGALEAARDPHSSVSAQDAELAVVNEAKRAGAAALQFDPNASAEEKAAQARAQVPPGFHHERKPRVAALVSDIDDGTGPKYDLPSPTTAGAIASPSPSTPSKVNADGHLADDEEAHWERVGGPPRFGEVKFINEDETSMLDHQTWLEGKLEDKFYGDWYHNTGIIIFACLTSYLTTVLGGGLGWVFIVMTFCGTYYRTSIRRARRNFRDDITRELAKGKLETDVESLEWINSFLVKFWPIYAPVLCTTIVNAVDQVLSDATPAFLDSLRLRTFVLGTKPPRLEHVKTYPKADDDIVLMDWKFSFTPKDVEDMTARQIKNKINPKIVLEVRVGKGMVSKGFDVIVEDMAFSGLMRVKVKLQIPFPHIEKAEICFLERPTIDYVCKPLGGDTFGFDVNFVPGLESFIMEQIHANLGPMMYAPNVFPIEIAKMLAGNPVDQAIGVLQVTFHGAQGLKNPDKFSGTPDPYAVVTINGRAELGRTKRVHENANPRWNETINIVVTSLKDTLEIQVYDYNEYRKDKELGKATFALEQLEKDPEHENQQLEVLANGRPRGVVQADIRFFPVLEETKLADGTVIPPPESTTGIAKFTVEQAKDLDGSKSLIGQLNPYAVLLLNGKEVQISKKLKRTNNPIWTDATKELLITHRKTAKLGLVIKDDRDLVTDPIIGSYQIKLDDLLDLSSKGQEWFNLAGVKTGRAKMSLQWKPVDLKGGISGVGGYITPIGVMRLHFQSARDLRNLEAMGKSDPYVRVLLSGIEKGRTVTFKNNLNPDWDEVIYVPVHTPRERLTLEVMDAENLGKDRSLGHIEIAAAEYIRQDENGEYLVSENKRTLSEPLRMGPSGQSKGRLNFTCSFYPTYNVADPEEEEKRPSEETSRNNSVGKVSDVGRNSNSLDVQRIRSGTISSLRTNGTTNGEVDPLTKLSQGEREQEETLPPKKELPKVRVTVDNLTEFESGLIVFTLIDGEFAGTDCRLEILMDDMVFPSYSSTKIKSRHNTFNETAEAMVRELEFSQITLRLVEKADKKGEGDQEHIIARLKGPTLNTLKRCLYTPTQLHLRDEEGRESKITVSLKYIPIKMRLDPSESINNSGSLRVDVLDAANLPAADRNGYSDPYCKFVLNDKTAHKTQTIKKTLQPTWNESFEVQIRSRTAAQFEVHVYDWDFGDKADFLGKAAINLDLLEPFQPQEVRLALDGKSGTIRLRMLFKPDYVTRSRQGSSTFSGTFAAVPGKVIGAPVKGVGKGAVFVGGGVAKGASFIGRGLKKRKTGGMTVEGEDSTPEPTINEPVPESSPMSNGDSPAALRPLTATNVDSPRSGPNLQPETPSPSVHGRTASWGSRSMASTFGTYGTSPGGAAAGIATVSIIAAYNYPPSAHVRVHLVKQGSKGGKDVHKTKALKASDGGDVKWAADSETCKVACTADSQFKVRVVDHGSFHDKELGEGVFFVDDQGAGGAEKTVRAGNGSVVVRTGFVPAEKGAGVKGESPGRGLRRGLFGTKRESLAPGA